MTRPQRIIGGEKNNKSGQKWSKDELTKVLLLYKKTPNLKIHESNKDIEALALSLNRTTRSVEAQLLMFRNLDKHGDYGFGNMSKLCKVVWREYLQTVIK